MANTHTAVTLIVSASLPAGVTNTSTPLNNSFSYALIMAQVTNGATAPTTPCLVTVSFGATASGPWYQWTQGTAGLAVGASYSLGWELPPAFMFAQVVFSGHTGQAVTVAAQAQTTTTV